MNGQNSQFKPGHYIFPVFIACVFKSKDLFDLDTSSKELTPGFINKTSLFARISQNGIIKTQQASKMYHLSEQASFSSGDRGLSLFSNTWEEPLDILTGHKS